MTELALAPASTLSLAERVTLFNAGYEGYLIPMHLDETQLAFMIDAFDIDLDASLVAFRDGEPVGFGNLAVRSEDGWVGGVGIVTSARRSGVGEAVMNALHERARERGLKRVWLEVIVENAPAFALYEKLGYRTVGDVEVWTLQHSVSEQTDAEDVPASEATARLPDRHEPWQRADGTLAHYDDLRGLVTGDGAAIYRQSGENVQLLRIAGAAEPLLRALRTLGSVSILNLQADDPAAAVFHALGGTVAVRQHEMVLEL